MHFLIGIDEAGRGPLAGPVVVAGIKIRNTARAHEFFKGIRDSKKLSPRGREEWFSSLTKNPHIEYAVARVWPSVIDKINIARATHLAARRVYERLSADHSTPAVLDGGLFLPAQVPQKTIIKGDERIPVIAAASIIAKVTRDRIMVRLHKKYPKYRFDIHKGYGTKLHQKLLIENGYSHVHRRSFHIS